MRIVRGKDRGYSASQACAMGRMCVGDGPSMATAILRCGTLLEAQEGEAYAHEQCQTHHSIQEAKARGERI